MKTDSGQGDDETSSNSSHSWQIEDGEKIDESLKVLEKRFQSCEIHIQQEESK